MLYSKYTVETLTQYPEFTRKNCAHLYPQYIYVGDGVDVYRYENFTSDLQKILTRFEIAKAIPSVNKSGHQHYSTYYSEMTREIVRKIYAEDIRRFGYTFETDAPISILTMMTMPGYTALATEKNADPSLVSMHHQSFNITIHHTSPITTNTNTIQPI